MDEVTKSLVALLDDAHFRYGHEIFLSAHGRYVNSRGDYLDPYQVLIKVDGLRDAVSRGRDLLSVHLAKQGIEKV